MMMSGSQVQVLVDIDIQITDLNWRYTVCHIPFVDATWLFFEEEV
jgi:hypothetical protein